MEGKIESGVQLFSRINTRKENLSGLNTKLCGEENLQNLSLEIVSDYTTDRNHLLLDFIVRCILPNSLNPCWKNCGVVFINTSYQIGVLQVIKTMDRHLKDLNVKNRKQIIEDSLKNLILLNCYNVGQFEMTIYSLEEKIKKRPNVSCLVLDEITAFYWIKRLEQDMISTYTYSQKNFNMVLDVIRGSNLFFLFGRTENNENNRDKRLSTNVDYQIIVHTKTNNGFEARVRSYKSDNTNIVKYSYNNFKVNFD